MQFVQVQIIEIVPEKSKSIYDVPLDLVQSKKCSEIEMLRSGKASIERREAWINIRQVTAAIEAPKGLRELGIGTEIFLTGLAREDYRFLVAESLEDIWRQYASGPAPAEGGS